MSKQNFDFKGRDALRRHNNQGNWATRELYFEEHGRYPNKVECRDYHKDETNGDQHPILPHPEVPLAEPDRSKTVVYHLREPIIRIAYKHKIPDFVRAPIGQVSVEGPIPRSFGTGSRMKRILIFPRRLAEDN